MSKQVTEAIENSGTKGPQGPIKNPLQWTEAIVEKPLKIVGQTIRKDRPRTHCNGAIENSGTNDPQGSTKNPLRWQKKRPKPLKIVGQKVRKDRPRTHCNGKKSDRGKKNPPPPATAMALRGGGVRGKKEKGRSSRAFVWALFFFPQSLKIAGISSPCGSQRGMRIDQEPTAMTKKPFQREFFLKGGPCCDCGQTCLTSMARFT